MEFRAPSIAARQNAQAIDYLTKNLSNEKASRNAIIDLMDEIGGATENYPDWHPMLEYKENGSTRYADFVSNSPLFTGIDHTQLFVRGLVTCPYSEETAESIVEAANAAPHLIAYRIDYPLYSDDAYPVVVIADFVELEADGTIRSKDALRWYLGKIVETSQDSRVAETWWTMRSSILGSPHGSRSSLFVNQHTGIHMRKILEALNESGIFGPIKEWSLEMLSERKRNSICENLIRAALKEWTGHDEDFTFELRGEVCRAKIRDNWNDGSELSVGITINTDDLLIRGFHYPKEDRLTFTEPVGKEALAKKFI